MAHYAILDENNVVINVITGKDEGTENWEKHYADVFNIPATRVKRTSYNTRMGLHINGGTPYRKNYAGIGFIYDATIDGFVPPKPFNSAVLNAEKGLWEAPVPIPTTPPPAGKVYLWDEPSLGWVLKDLPTNVVLN